MCSLRSLMPLAAASLALLLNSCSMGKFPVRTYQMGEEPSLRIPQNRFFLVRASVVNSGSTELTAPNVSIVDDNGKIYPELVNGESTPQWIGYLRQLKP